MKRTVSAALLLVTLLAACQQQSVAESEQIKNVQTLTALTPTITPTPTNTATATATSTPTPTLGPSPTPLPPTITPIPSPTPLPPTATPNPALSGFSLCQQPLGSQDGGRFSARISAITTTVELAYERLTLTLDLAQDSAAPYALVRCVAADKAGTLTIDLPGWLLDDGFKTSAITTTREITGTALIKRLQLTPSDAIAGATLTIPLDAPHAFRAAIETKPYRLVIDIAKDQALSPASDMLTVASTPPQPPASTIFYLQGGDIWSIGKAKPLNITEAIRDGQYGDVTAIAVSQPAGVVAFCATDPGAESVASAPSTLWIMGLDGSDQRLLADPGRTCADPTIDPTGGALAFAVDETGAQPQRLTIYRVDLKNNEKQTPLTPQGDAWSRFAPQWLAGGALVYAASAEDGRSTLFLRSADGTEVDIGAPLILGDRYRALGRPLASRDGSAVAVEGQRATTAGADLLLLDANGSELTTLSPIGGGYWTRPIAWGDDGALYYLTSACAADSAQSYTLAARSADGKDRTLAAGMMRGTIGDAVALANGIAYVASAQAPQGARGPRAVDQASPASLWLFTPGDGARGAIVTADSGIGALGR